MDCVLHKGAISSTGYGAVWRRGKSMGAHRAAFEDSVGPIPAGFMVLHSCDNKACVNPLHLRIGTAKENAKDAMERGQIATGERHGRRTKPESTATGSRNGMASMTDKVAIKALEMRASGKKLREISGALNISVSAASRLCRRETYADALLAALGENP